MTHLKVPLPTCAQVGFGEPADMFDDSSTRDESEDGDRRTFNVTGGLTLPFVCTTTACNGDNGDNGVSRFTLLVEDDKRVIWLVSSLGIPDPVHLFSASTSQRISPWLKQ
ncbi:hypothetical protein HPB47_019601 [Ixodes persulcatus]|uniref:Uncharacterized protein n=1 Tax=Ixodes persulcatus TaxID=34615 RepID=A0AC60QLB2_IXOPE|nr:hypothetical protein HPB47_019601 [Ixodes persulcatus]